MSLTFSNSGKKINLSDIKDFQNKFKLNLPNEYIDFLLKYNGGIPNSVYFLEDDSDVVINFFLSLGREEFNIEEYYIDMVIEQKNIPNDILPIAEDAFGNIICISCRETDYGKIYFWDHEDGESLIEISKNISFLLNNLNEEV
jgi:hypothetical protein